MYLAGAKNTNNSHQQFIMFVQHGMFRETLEQTTKVTLYKFDTHQQKCGLLFHRNLLTLIPNFLSKLQSFKTE
jgi:uncharacterized protein (DUF1501 family)